MSCARKVAKGLASLLLKVIGIRVEVRGLEHLKRGAGAKDAAVLVVNHASYIDALVLAAILPTEYSFVAKKELLKVPLLGRFLRKLGILFVDRFNAEEGIGDTDQILAAARSGKSVVFFPEGTFVRAAGLRPFRMGAYLVAARAGLPVIPLSISGTRSILRSDQWFLRPGRVRATVAPPLQPSGDTWEAAVRLRDNSHSAILANCGEPAVSEIPQIG
jgi:1-acyl-sn-glycerol-3-phosphate acyltransferase